MSDLFEYQVEADVQKRVRGELAGIANNPDLVTTAYAEKVRRLEHENDQLQPKADFYDTVTQRDAWEEMSAVAFGVLSGISRAGMTPGQDVAVVTFDHVEQAELWDPPITTVGVDPIQLGVRAARLLVQRSNEPTGPRESVVLLPELRIRESSS